MRNPETNREQDKWIEMEGWLNESLIQNQYRNFVSKLQEYLNKLKNLDQNLEIEVLRDNSQFAPEVESEDMGIITETRIIKDVVLDLEQLLKQSNPKVWFERIKEKGLGNVPASKDDLAASYERTLEAAWGFDVPRRLNIAGGTPFSLSRGPF